jgi:ribosomal protein L37E
MQIIIKLQQVTATAAAQCGYADLSDSCTGYWRLPRARSRSWQAKRLRTLSVQDMRSALVNASVLFVESLLGVRQTSAFLVLALRA